MTTRPVQEHLVDTEKKLCLFRSAPTGTPPLSHPREARVRRLLSRISHHPHHAEGQAAPARKHALFDSLRLKIPTTPNHDIEASTFEELPLSDCTMSPRNEGILDSPDWDDVTPSWNEKPKWLTEEQSDWKPARLLRFRRPSRSTLARLGCFLWPIKDTKQADMTLRPTAYLDGLRGFAAFLVYWHHNELWAHEPKIQNRIFENSFGYEGKFHFVAFPGVRHLFTGGHFAVSVFFVISGYVLAAKPLGLIQNGHHARMAESVGSALFRRWLRLYIPVAVTTFVFMSFLHAFDVWVDNIDRSSSWREDVWVWYCELKNFSFIFTSGSSPFFSWNRHLWSIPVEMKGSIIVYTALLAFSRCTVNARLWCEAGLAFYFMYIADGWYGAMFVTGMLLCDLDLLARKDELPAIFKKLEPAKTFIFYHLFVASMYLGGVPSYTGDVNNLGQNRGWYYLSLLKPQAVFDYKWFYLFWAAALLVASVPRIRWLRAFFETRFCQYLGRISFALYLVHGPVLGVLGDRIYTAVGWWKDSEKEHLAHLVDRFLLSKVGPLGLEPAFLIPHLVLLPLTLWLAEVVTLFVDEPSVRFAQWLYGKTLSAPPATMKA
ncbi:acyltransferase [Colletotrichum musicola]|uniref:Acyltransferase n=1 Tax=Colletotrichum musicola TaxID=2175873 RepID=A0A8H6J6Q9_9PEZI|nr:acyltransferase [Colletotrichum musicola]